MLQWGSKTYIFLRNNGKPQTSKNLTLGDETPYYGPHRGKLVHNSRGRNFGILPSFDAHDTSLEIYIRGLQLLIVNIEYGRLIFIGSFMPKKCRLGPQNSSGSLGPEKLSKIVNCATIKETEKLKETMVGSKGNKRVATNIHLDQGVLQVVLWITTILFKIRFNLSCERSMSLHS